jgi:myo-inositol-1(or 4)-monophosphatase
MSIAEKYFMEPMLNVALRAARKAGELLEKITQHGKPLAIESKGRNDYVTEVDRALEKEIIYHLHKAYPDHTIHAEECGLIEGNSPDYKWLIDPLDGTTNFIHGIPHFAISIGCLYKGQLQHGVVLDPIKREEFTASRGSGAYLNNRRIRVTNHSGLDGALIATGIPFSGFAYDKIKPYLACLEDIAGKTAGIRRIGAASLDLAYVAAGRFEGFWEMNLKPWDMAAGLLLIQEAGGLVSDFSGDNKIMASGNIVGATPKVFKPLLQVVEKYLKDV